MNKLLLLCPQAVGHSREPSVGFVCVGVSGLLRQLRYPDAGSPAGSQPALGEEVCGLRRHAGARRICCAVLRFQPLAVHCHRGDRYKVQHQTCLSRLVCFLFKTDWKNVHSVTIPDNKEEKAVIITFKIQSLSGTT